MFSVLRPVPLFLLLSCSCLAQADADTAPQVVCRAAAGAEALAETLCAAVTARLLPGAPSVTVEVIAAHPQAISARLATWDDGGLRWGEPVTLNVMDRAGLPPGAIERLARALLRQAPLAPDHSPTRP